MGLFNTSKEMLDAIKSIVTDGRKQYAEEQQEMDKIVAEKILSPKQKKIAAVAGDKDKIDAADFAALRAGKKVAEATGNPGPVRKPIPHSFKEKPSKEDMAAWHAKQKMTKEEVEVLDEGDFSDWHSDTINGHTIKAHHNYDSGSDSTYTGSVNGKRWKHNFDNSAAHRGMKEGDLVHRNNPHLSKDEAHAVAKYQDKHWELHEATERDTPGQHSCAVHVKHSTFGEGKALYSQHAEPDEAGLIEWYDIMFEHGIEKQVPTSDLEVLEAMSHGNHKGKK